MTTPIRWPASTRTILREAAQHLRVDAILLAKSGKPESARAAREKADEIERFLKLQIEAAAEAMWEANMEMKGTNS